MRSHFILPPRVTAACAVAGAASLLNGTCAGQSFVAADYASNPTYASSWADGQNGGYGFGPWSFAGTDMTPAGQYEGMSTGSALGRAWTLATYANHTGLADAGRAITEAGGLQPGQTLEMVIQNPTGYYFYRGFDIVCLNSTTNNPGGVNTAALRTQVFAYFSSDWNISDATHPKGLVTPVDWSVTAAAGMKYALTLTSTNTYSLTLTPLSDPASAYTQTGMLNPSLPINWINFRLYWGTSTGLNDPADNFEISSMTIRGLNLNIQAAGANVNLSWPTNAAGFSLVTSTNLSAPVWTPVSTPPVIVNDQNVVTDSVAGGRRFYRLQQ